MQVADTEIVTLEVLDVVGALLLVCCLLLLAVVVRRIVLRRFGAGVDLALRTPASGRWSVGMARFAGEQLEWFRLFSLSPRPSATLPRQRLRVRGARRPSSGEQLSLMTGATVLACCTDVREVEIAMPELAVTGFTAWVESLPPGASMPSVID